MDASMKSRPALIAVALAVLAVTAYAAFAYLIAPSDAPPAGFASSNGRLEADRVEISAKTPGRIAAVEAQEGDMVRRGQTLALIDVAELRALLDRAEAETALAEQMRAEAEALVLQRRSELRRAEQMLARGDPLRARDVISQADYEDRETDRDVAAAALRAADAAVETAIRRIAAARAEERRVAALIDDGALTAPVDGRVLYRLAEPGEIARAGEPLLTLLSLDQVYMEIFLPAEQAAQVAIGGEARIVFDVLPDYAVPAVVSFVSPEAQFTPKQVETMEERQKLVFRVRVRIPPDLVRDHIEHVKTGLRGVAWVKLSPAAVWPEALDRRIPAEVFE
jgi:HlyD family secretion protein